MIDCVLVSDINNEPAGGRHFCERFPPEVNVRWLLLSELSGAPELSGSDLHAHSIQGGGFRLAVDSILRQEAADFAIGFSAGGTALWRACLAGFDCRYLWCVSATRLREEVRMPQACRKVYFGGDDPGAPSASLFVGNIDVIASEGHDAYLDANSEMSRRVSGDVLKAMEAYRR